MLLSQHCQLYCLFWSLSIISRKSSQSREKSVHSHLSPEIPSHVYISVQRSQVTVISVQRYQVKSSKSCRFQLFLFNVCNCVFNVEWVFIRCNNVTLPSHSRVLSSCLFSLKGEVVVSGKCLRSRQVMSNKWSVRCVKSILSSQSEICLVNVQKLFRGHSEPPCMYYSCH